MKEIGIISENPNDTKAIKALLERAFSGKITCFDLLPNINGSDLDDKRNNHVIHKLRTNFQIFKPDIVLYMRDLDGLYKERNKRLSRKRRFGKFNKVVEDKGIFLLHIYEIEALILADFERFKDFFGNATWEFESKKAHLEFEPKEKLQSFIKYKETDCPKLFAVLDFDTVCQNHIYFNNFVQAFEILIQ